MLSQTYRAESNYNLELSKRILVSVTQENDLIMFWVCAYVYDLILLKKYDLI